MQALSPVCAATYDDYVVDFTHVDSPSPRSIFYSLYEWMQKDLSKGTSSTCKCCILMPRATPCASGE